MPDRPETESPVPDSALLTRCVRGLISANAQGAAMPAPGLADAAMARSVRDQIIAHRIAGGERRIGFRLADGLLGILTDGMQFAAELVVPAGRLVAPRARPALAFHLARAVTASMDAADLPPSLGAVALAIDIGDCRFMNEATEADHIADNAGTGCYVVGPWRAITGRFADRELLLEASMPGDAAASSSVLFADPVEEAMQLLQRCRAAGESLPEGSVLLIVGKAAPLPVGRGTSLVLAAGEIGTLTAEISA